MAILMNAPAWFPLIRDVRAVLLAGHTMQPMQFPPVGGTTCPPHCEHPGEFCWQRSLVLAYLCDLCSGFGLSILALCMASLLRLLLFACSLRGGNYNNDPIIRIGRGVVRGAPMKFWLSFVVILNAHHVHAMQQPDVGTRPAAHVPGDSDVQIQLLGERVDGLLEQYQDMTDYWFGSVDSLPRILSGRRGADDLQDEPMEPPARVPIRILRYQRTDIWMNMVVSPGTDTIEFVERASSAILDSDQIIT